MFSRYLKAGDIGDAGKGHSGGVAAVAFSPNGEFLASAGLDAKVCIWYTADLRLLHVFVGGSAVLSLAWVKDGQLLCGAEDGSIFALSISPARLHAKTFPRNHSYPVEHLAVKGKSLVSGAHEEVAVWAIESGSWGHHTDLPAPPVNSNNRDRDILVSSTCWTRSRNSKQSLLLVTYLYHGYVIYDTKNWRRVFAIPMNGLVGHASVASDGTQLVVSNMTSGFDIYETDTGTALGTINHPVGGIFAVPVLFAHDSKVVIGGSALGAAHIWDASTYHLRQTLPHTATDQVLALAAHQNRVTNRHLIATGASNAKSHMAISLWYVEESQSKKSRFQLTGSWLICWNFTFYLVVGILAGFMAMLLGVYIGEAPINRTLAWL